MRQRKDQAGGFGICLQKQSRKEKYKGELEGKTKQKNFSEVGWWWKCDSLPTQESSQEIPSHRRTVNFNFILARTWLIVEVAKTVSKREFAELKGGSQPFQNDTDISSFTTSF